ncbi:alpha/beta-hydrolase [Obba rivulosa]|uniref:Alpha/beta-hydrolase n=1 Tax=Obba rivulosa TaxID=1052685 RepID=A0A8E2J576_9APHY|nr:alpha/beta-hydrolase [Obba rivulosa]
MLASIRSPWTSRLSTPITKSTYLSHRRLASSVTPVKLHYDKYIPEDGNETEAPLVILHGLLGTKRNWGSLSKAFLRDLKRPVYALDLRNHGTSPHAEPMTYLSMASDVLQFCKDLSLHKISLLGHSMGGKVAMTVALNRETPEDILSHLIVADIAPSKGKLSDEFDGYIRALKKIEESHVRTRQDAQKILEPYEKVRDPLTRAFLLTNFESSHHSPLKAKIPIDIVGRSIPEIGSFPYEPSERTWEGPTLFIKGAKSRYINDRNISIAKQFFPNMVLETLDAGHWVHSERPHEFKALVENFLQSH